MEETCSENGDEEHERRTIRHKYRDLINDTQKQRDELIRPESNRLTERLSEANVLFKKVKKTREAALDSQLIYLCAAVGKQQAQALHTDFLTFQPLEFAEKLITFMGASRVNPDSEENTQASQVLPEHWKHFGKTFGPLLKKAPSFHYIHGSFEVGDVEVKPRRKQSKQKDKDVPVKAVKPAAVGSHAAGKQETTTEEVEGILKLLQQLYIKHDKQAICYFEFVTDPDSFSHTVENMFHVSFLIKDNAVRVFLDDDNLPVIEPILESNDEGNPGTKNHQVIMSITIDEWKSIVETFKIKRPVIPSRKRHHNAAEKEI